MKRSITTIFACALCAVSTSQTSAWSWAKEGVGPSTDIGHAVATDASGNVYSTGVFAGTTSIVFGTYTLASSNVPNQYDEPNKDIFLVKYDRDGNIIWAISGGGANMERSYTIDTDGSGNVYIGGSSSSTVLTLGTVTVNKDGSEDFFVAKIDNAGNVLWIRTGDGDSQNFVKGLAADNNGNVVVTGFNQGDHFAVGTTTLNGVAGAVFTAKYDTNGNLLWVRNSFQNTDSYYAFGQGVDIDSRLGDIFVTGYFSNKTLAFGSHTITNGKYGIDNTEDIFIVKYASNGDVIWAKSFGGTTNERGIGVAVASSPDPYYSSEVYLAGHFGGSVLVADSKTLTNTNAQLGNQDIFVLKLESYTGKVLWASQVHGSGRDLANGIAGVGNAGVVVLGTYASSVLTSGTLTAAKTNSTGGNGTDIVVAGFDRNGQAVLLKAAGGSNNDEGGGIAVDTEVPAVYVNGMYSSNPMNFDAIQLYTTGFDVFTAQLSAPEYESLILLGLADKQVSDWTISPNPTSSNVFINTGKAHGSVSVTVHNVLGQQILDRNYYATSQINLDLTGLPTGIYNVSLVTGNSRCVVKVIKN